MSNINERLDKIKEKFTDDNFLTNKGLGNEVGIYIFGYDPEDEMTVRYFLEKIKKESGFRTIQYDLYDIFVDNLKNRKLLERVSALEERSGKEIVEKQLKMLMPPKMYVENMKYPNHQYGDIVVISGVDGVACQVAVNAGMNKFEAMKGKVYIVKTLNRTVKVMM
jgi:hypothetical protein